jgi:S1-C subfamily serine protease
MPTEQGLSAFSTALADLAERVSPAVVQVRASGARPTTGTVVGEDRVLAVDHTIAEDEGLVVRTSDGRDVRAEVAGHDPSTDLALLRAPGLAVAPLGRAAEPRVGALSLALGRSPSGRLVAGAGIISTVGATLHSGRGPRVDGLIITHAGPFRGFSGGAVVDVGGGLIGIGNAGLVRGTGLVVPIATARRVADALDTHGRVTRGYLGITSQPVGLREAQRAGRDQATGLLIVGIAPDSPAERASLLLGDIVLTFAGEPIAGTDDLLSRLTAERIGTVVPLDVIRAGAARAVQVTVGETAVS